MPEAADSVPFPFQVVQPVTMTSPQDASTMAYLQHSMAPIAPAGSVAPLQFGGAFPTPSGMAAFPAFSAFPPPAPPAPTAGPLTVAAPVLQPGAMGPTGPLLNAPNQIPIEHKGGGAFPTTAQNPSTASTDSEAPSADGGGAVPAVAQSYSELLEQLSAFGMRIPLQNDNVDAYEPDFSLDAALRHFMNGHSLLDALAMVEYTARRLAANAPPQQQTANSAHPNPQLTLADVGRHLLNTMSAVNQLPGWLHVERYIRNPQAYVDNTKAVQLPGPKHAPNPNAPNPNTSQPTAPLAASSAAAVQTTQTTAPLAASSAAAAAVTADGAIDDGAVQTTQTTAPLAASSAAAAAVTADGAIDELIAKGVNLMKRLLLRIGWVQHLQVKEQKGPDPETFLKVIGADRLWASDAHSFLKEAEVKVTAMLTDNQPKFHAFRELQRKGVQWPHSAAVRKDIESAGFVLRPMMIKRDRCVCETCLIEISGWRPWQNAWAFHDYSRHMPVFLERARSACAQNKVVMMVLDEAKARLTAAANRHAQVVTGALPEPVTGALPATNTVGSRARPPVPRFDGSNEPQGQ